MTMSQVKIGFIVTETTRYEWTGDHSDLPIRVYFALDEEDQSEWEDQIRRMSHSQAMSMTGAATLVHTETDHDIRTVDLDPLDEYDDDDDDDDDEPAESVPVARAPSRPF